MKLPLKEPLSARYVYPSAENILYVFLPVVSGRTIGLDNTCKAVYALQEFFDKGHNSYKKASLKAELGAYKEALEHDTELLAADSELALQKKERLHQIEAYLQVLNVVAEHTELDCLNAGFPSYPRPLEGMMQDRATSNLYGMVLRPSIQDGFLRTEGAKPIFSVAHKSVARNIDNVESTLQKALIKAYSPLHLKAQDIKEELTQKVITQLNDTTESFDFNGLRETLQQTVQDELNVLVDFSKTPQGETISKEYIDELMDFDGTEEPKEYIDTLLNCCVADLFNSVTVSPFKYLTKAEDWSVATQFLLGLINIYCVAQDKVNPETNFGQILDGSEELSAGLATTLAEAQQRKDDIETVCFKWINDHTKELGLKTALTQEEMKTLKQDFAKRYVQIKASPHFDEFLILDTEQQGAFVMHQGSICTSFAEFVNSPLLDIPKELIQPLEKARNEAKSLGVSIPHENTLVQNEVEIDTATLDQAQLQALYERIDSYPDLKLKEQLFAELKTECPEFKPQINPKQFLQHVAYGQQNEAEALLKKDVSIAQELLTARDQELTDYSGRTFKCTAYEYAWWAKDSHMRFMLERYMDEDTKQEVLKRVQHSEALIGAGLIKKPRGIAYTQNGKEFSSTHFDLTPLKKALSDYIKAYNQSPKQTDTNWEALDQIWIKVGLLQREVPAHIAHEYCHPKRSFDDVLNNTALLDASKPENNLERGLKFYNYETASYDVWFTPGALKGPGLGSSFAIIRGGYARGGWGMLEMVGIGIGGWGSIDLSAIEAIDKARTDDLKRSLANLAAPSTLQAAQPPGS